MKGLSLKTRECKMMPSAFGSYLLSRDLQSFAADCKLGCNYQNGDALVFIVVHKASFDRSTKDVVGCIPILACGLSRLW